MFPVADGAVGDAGLDEDGRLRSDSSPPLTVAALLADDLVRRKGSRDLIRGGDWGLAGVAAEGIVPFEFGTAASGPFDGLLDEGDTLDVDAGVTVDADVVRRVDGDEGGGAVADAEADAESCCFSV